MNKSELIDAMARESLLSKVDAEKALNAMLVVVQNALKEGEDINLVGFGSFSVKVTPARNGRNFKTGEMMRIAESKSVRFKQGKNLKEFVNA